MIQHRTALIIFTLYHPHNHHSSDVVCWREEKETCRLFVRTFEGRLLSYNAVVNVADFDSTDVVSVDGERRAL